MTKEMTKETKKETAKKETKKETKAEKKTELQRFREKILDIKENYNGQEEFSSSGSERDKLQAMADLKKLADEISKEFIGQYKDKALCYYRSFDLRHDGRVKALKQKAEELCKTVQSREYKLQRYEKQACNPEDFYDFLTYGASGTSNGYV